MKSFFHFMILKAITWVVFILFYTGCEIPGGQKNFYPDDFRFVFLTDAHFLGDSASVAGLQRCIATINKQKPQLVIAGGDMLHQLQNQQGHVADSLYGVYMTLMGELKAPVYYTPGNHELAAFRPAADSLQTDTLKALFRQYHGSTFQSFTFKGWKFFLLDGIQPDSLGGYRGNISQEQLSWMAAELETTAPQMPVVLVSHIPLVSVAAQLYKGGLEANPSGMVVENSHKVLELFAAHNLKMVLSGHLHTLEYVEAGGTKFLNSGAVSGAWWQGRHQGTDPGFTLLEVKKGALSWEYMGY